MLKHLWGVATVAIAALAACGDSTQPSQIIATGGPSLSVWDPPVVIDVLQRTQPLLHDFAATTVLGRGGGVLRIPEAGLTIVFPPNAVRVATPVTVTAMPGTAVAYEFQPHGLQFIKRPLILQELRGTEVFGDAARLRDLEGAYFADPSLLSGLTAVVTETRPTQVDVSGWTMRFEVEHFSGYTAATGRSGYLNASGNVVPFDH